MNHKNGEVKKDEWQKKEECVGRVTWLNHTYLFSHAVKFVGQFMFAPPLLFMVVVQRIIQYLRGIIEQGLLFSISIYYSFKCLFRY